MGNWSYMQFGIKRLLAYIVYIIPCFVIMISAIAGEEAKPVTSFMDMVEPIKMKDPLASVLGVKGEGSEFVYTYRDAVKFAGHSCPAVAGAFKSTQLALKSLYVNDTPVRGEIRVTFRGDIDYKANGPISQVTTFITGAAGRNGFKGIGPMKRYKRYQLMSFDKDNPPGKEEICSILFQRLDTGKKVEVTYAMKPLPQDARINELMPLILSNKASEAERREFGELWQERVKIILLNPQEGMFSVKELE